MSWEDQHRQRVAAMPTNIREAHKRSSNHREEITRSAVCGCFYCGATFPPGEIEEWVDEVEGVGQTALCPKCGIDSVIGDHGGYPIAADFLSSMRAFWF